MSHPAFTTFLEYGVEVLVTTCIAVIGFFLNRTLTSYDRRIRDIERRETELLKTIQNIEKQVVHISALLEIKRK